MEDSLREYIKRRGSHMHFTKMQGAGNDYIYVNGFAEKIENPERAAVILSDRHFGVGADGLIILEKSEIADFKMVMYNSDGSRGRMCGNGIRCAVCYACKYGIVKTDCALVETDSGVKQVFVKGESFLVDMGMPSFDKGEKPDISFIDGVYASARVDVGNPHFVVFVRDIESVRLKEWGSRLENAPEFPDRANIEFVQMVDAEHMQLLVWERGSGATLSCGTGTCAAGYAAFNIGLAKERLSVINPGGVLEVIKNRDTLMLAGPAEFVFEGDMQL